MPTLKCAVFLLAMACACAAQDAQPLAERLAAQNALFDEYYESELRSFPERSTAFGDYRYNDQLADYSLRVIAMRDKSNRDYFARI